MNKNIIIATTSIAAIIILAVVFWQKQKYLTPTNTSSNQVVYVTGGLGGDQTYTVYNRLVTENKHIIVSGGSNEAYKENIANKLADYTKKDIILIGHSFGCDSIIDFYNANERFNVKGVFLIDPVMINWGDSSIKKDPSIVYVFYRTHLFGPKTAKIDGVLEDNVYNIDGGHNDFLHKEPFLDKLMELINGLQ